MRITWFIEVFRHQTFVKRSKWIEINQITWSLLASYIFQANTTLWTGIYIILTPTISWVRICMHKPSVKYLFTKSVNHLGIHLKTKPDMRNKNNYRFIWPDYKLHATLHFCWYKTPMQYNTFVYRYASILYEIRGSI